MSNIILLSDLKNYGEVVRKCENDEPLFLTENGSTRYVIQSYETYEKQHATIQLLTELSKGVETLHHDGGLTIEQTFAGLDG